MLALEALVLGKEPLVLGLYLLVLREQPRVISAHFLLVFASGGVGRLEFGMFFDQRSVLRNELAVTAKGPIEPLRGGRAAS